MSSPNQPTTHWQALAVAADNGDLYLNPETAQACHKACDMYITQLREHQATATSLAQVTGYGNFDMGRRLQTIFAEKAVGGDNNMFDVLQSHIDVVEEMKVVFGKFFAATIGTDEANAAGLQVDPPR
ncbi:hypothetical protein [Rhodococcoides fascians]|uniref:hypothetical protein n=1 Tax=Rhodococcoides fascians TaxID=1828 RepID=UPI00056D93C7|nr:hypothetical protein [Rhodococcus fascians]